MHIFFAEPSCKIGKKSNYCYQSIVTIATRATFLLMGPGNYCCKSKTRRSQLRCMLTKFPPFEIGSKMDFFQINSNKETNSYKWWKCTPSASHWHSTKQKFKSFMNRSFISSWLGLMPVSHSRLCPIESPFNNYSTNQWYCLRWALAVDYMGITIIFRPEWAF